MPHLVPTDLGLHCNPVSLKKDARLIWVKQVLGEVGGGGGGYIVF